MSWTGFESSAASIDTVAGGTRFNSATMATVVSKPGNWEGLRKQARALENEVDLKLVTFSKLGTSYSRGAGVRDDQQPLLGDPEAQSLDKLQDDLQSLLDKLGQVKEYTFYLS